MSPIGTASADVGIIDDRSIAVTMLGNLRLQVLKVLTEPGSATTVAAALGQPRQKVNYHLRALEEAGLVQLIEERPRRGVTERVMIASARSYVVSPEVLGPCEVQTERVELFSSQYLVALGARLIREVGQLTNAAEAAGKSLATLSIDTEIRFGSANDRAEFTTELTSLINSLVARYHDESTADGRNHRVIVAAHPTPKENRQ